MYVGVLSAVAVLGLGIDRKCNNYEVATWKICVSVAYNTNIIVYRKLSTIRHSDD